MAQDWRKDIEDWSEDRFDRHIGEVFERIGLAMANGNRAAELDQRAYVKELIAERDRRYPYPAT